MESMVRRPQKPFSVEVKRGRNGAASAAPAFFSKLVRQAVPVVEKRPATPAPELAKPPRRILEAIEMEPAPATAVEEAPVSRASLFAESIKPRRGRPPKVAPVEEPVVERPKLVARNDSATIYTFARRETVAVSAPVAPVAATPSKTKHAVVAQAAPTGTLAEPSAHGHVNHAERVEEATSLPRGERWKRRLPKVLW
jgi:hypothetical protein